MKKHLIWFAPAVLLIAGVTMLILAISGKPAAELHSPSSYVSSSQDVTIHFTEPMNPATFTEETVRLTIEDGEPQPVALEWNEENTVLTLKAPDSGYELDAAYQLTISHKVEAANGKKLTNPLSHTFTAAAELEQIENQQQLAQLLKERAPELVREQAEVGVTTAESSMDTVESSADNSGSAASNASSDVSTTNVQVAGIAEGDLIKTDGEHIYFARSNDIVITSADKEESTAVSTIAEENFHPAEIYLEGNLLISVGHTTEPIRLEETEPPPGDTIDIAPMPVQQSLTTVHIYDISDKTAPEKMREVSLEGAYKTSRKMDGQLYLTASQHPPFRIQQEENIEEARPFVKDTAVQSERAPVAFEDMYFFPESQENNYLLIGSIDLQNLDDEAEVQTYLGASNEFYMSENNIYLAVNQFEERNTSKETDTSMMASPAVNTKIMQFAIDDGAVSYQTSTAVPGRLINQFAMDERDGVFRVATTKGEMWGLPEQEPSTNNLYTFDTDLNPLGKVEGLAEGERIYSVRFMDQVAYMVTFRQVDPLFVIDLSNPQNPEVLGELKIPGFSNYLHPLDDEHVIGFGQHTTLQQQNGEEPLVMTEGLKISVFDVSNPENPKEKYSKVIGESGSYSELNHDHRALFQQPNSSLYGFPATLFNSETVKDEGMVYENQTLLHQGALLYEITPEEGIVWKDSITHQEADTEFPNEKSRIQRMVSIDGTLYTFSHNQATAYDIDAETILGTVQLPEQKQSY